MKPLQLEGQKFGNLTVIKRGPNNNSGSSRWWCQCECGNKTLVLESYLKSGHTKSCGCLKESTFQWKPMLNEKFGLLTVIEETKGDKKCLCKCDCGIIKKINRVDLRSGNTRSCGCITSRGEYKIGQILLENNIKFQTEYSFPDFLGEKKHPYRFDFAILNEDNSLKYLIEFDGRQHFQDTENYNGLWDVKESQKRDKIKNQYCLDHNIPLIRIPYTKLDTLTIEDLIL